MKTLQTIKCLNAIGDRFSGYSLDTRLVSDGWPKKFRLKLVCSKNRRGMYRLTAWGDTLDEVVSEMHRMVHREDSLFKANWARGWETSHANSVPSEIT